MRIICAWCKRDLGAGAGPGRRRTSHGICPSCHAHLLASLEGVPMQRFLDSLGVPVVLADADLRVVYGNPAARSLVDKPPAAIEGVLAGRVFECENSYLPGGCGQTTNCSACTLRNAVSRCYQSGQSEDGVLATIKRRTAEGQIEFSMRVSTRRINDQVLVRIDQIVD
jgi:PAS domain-containing protein